MDAYVPMLEISTPIIIPIIVPARAPTIPSIDPAAIAAIIAPPLIAMAIIPPMIPHKMAHKNIMQPFLKAKPHETIFSPKIIITHFSYNIYHVIEGR